MKTMKGIVAVGCALAASACLVTAGGNEDKAEMKQLQKQQQAERQALAAEMKGKNATDKQAVMEQHEKNVAYLKKQLATSNLTDGQREEIVNVIEEHLGKGISVDDPRLRELVDYIKKLSLDDSKNMQQKKADLKAFVIEKKAEYKADNAKAKIDEKLEKSRK